MENIVKKYCYNLTNRGVDRLVNMIDSFKSGFIGTLGAGGLLLWNAEAYVKRERDMFLNIHNKEKEMIIEHHKKEIEVLLNRIEKLEKQRWF